MIDNLQKSKQTRMKSIKKIQLIKRSFKNKKPVNPCEDAKTREQDNGNMIIQWKEKWWIDP